MKRAVALSNELPHNRNIGGESIDFDGMAALFERMFWLARMDAKRGDREAIEFLQVYCPERTGRKD